MMILRLRNLKELKGRSRGLNEPFANTPFIIFHGWIFDNPELTIYFGETNHCTKHEFVFETDVLISDQICM